MKSQKTETTKYSKWDKFKDWFYFDFIDNLKFVGYFIACVILGVIARLINIHIIMSVIHKSLP